MNVVRGSITEVPKKRHMREDRQTLRIGGRIEIGPRVVSLKNAFSGLNLNQDL